MVTGDNRSLTLAQIVYNYAVVTSLPNNVFVGQQLHYFYKSSIRVSKTFSILLPGIYGLYIHNVICSEASL